MRHDYLITFYLFNTNQNPKFIWLIFFLFSRWFFLRINLFYTILIFFAPFNPFTLWFVIFERSPGISGSFYSVNCKTLFPVNNVILSVEFDTIRIISDNETWFGVATSRNESTDYFLSGLVLSGRKCSCDEIEIEFRQ